MSELSPSLAETTARPTYTEQELRALGETLLAAVVDTSQLAQHQTLSDNPNSFMSTPLLSHGNIPTEADKVYRQVGIEAVADLAMSGIVRNGATARGTEHHRWGHRVFWNSGKPGKTMTTGGRAVIVASKDAAAKGWVTLPDVEGIYVQPRDSVINLLDRNS